MRLALSGLGRYTDFSDGYKLYVNRARMKEPMDLKTYKRIVKLYCKKLSERLESEGMIDLPSGLGIITVANLKRKLQFIGDKMVGYGAMDWKTGQRDGNINAFGLVYLPRRDHNHNLRCFGFVANRRLFKRLKEKNFSPMNFKEEMV